MDKKKYNLALLPMHIGADVISIAKQFKHISDQYLLRDNASLPHVTLYQFWSYPKVLSEIWQKAIIICNKPIELSFQHFSFTTSNKTKYWIALLPEQSQILHEIHKDIANLLRLPIKHHFDPHMTLANTQKSNCSIELEHAQKKFTPLKDHFVIALGKCDAHGQFTKIIYHHADLTYIS